MASTTDQEEREREKAAVAYAPSALTDIKYQNQVAAEDVHQEGEKPSEIPTKVLSTRNGGSSIGRLAAVELTEGGPNKKPKTADNTKPNVGRKPSATATASTKKVAHSNAKPKLGDKPTSTATTSTEKVPQSKPKPGEKKNKPEKNSRYHKFRKPTTLLEAAPGVIKDAAKDGKIARQTARVWSASDQPLYNLEDEGAARRSKNN
ncbi:MAG: hypothetical protein Q9218_001767 [Villophora microphyllina]